MPYFKRLDNAELEEKQEIFKSASLLTTCKDPLNIRFEQSEKEVTKLGLRYSEIDLQSKKACYKCRLKGTLIQCANCPACYHQDCEKWQHIKHEKDKEGELCQKCFELYKSDELSCLNKKVKFRMPKFPKYHSLNKDCYQVNLLSNKVFKAAVKKYDGN